MGRYISIEPQKRKNMGWDFLFKALRLISVWVLFFSTVDTLAKENPDSNPALTNESLLEPVVVAVIDTGIDTTHPLLKNRLWTNPGEIPGNGIDDDGNGLIDDVHGWNFVDHTNRVQDKLGHGTHISGIIAAAKDEDLGIQGIAPNARIMSLKYFDPETTGYQNLQSSIQAIEYAIKMKAQIINYSGGGAEFSKEEREALAKAEGQGILVVAAAGNEKSDTDQKPFYPANYGLKNILSVAAVDKNSLLLPSSNFGKKSVALAAPGYKVLSTIPGGRFGQMTGTSQATAFVSGIAARLMGEGHRSLQETIEAIIRNVEMKTSLSRMVASQGQLNIERTLSMKSSRQSALGQITEPNSNLENKLILWKLSDSLL